MSANPAIRLRPTREDDLAWVTTLERHPDNVDLIGQWDDATHLEAIRGGRRRSHWIIERDGAPAGYLIAYDCVADGAGVYVKRILVADKEKGTGRAALAAYLASLDARVPFVWLNVRNDNARAQKVYASLGFARYEARGEELARFDAAAEVTGAGAFKMRKMGSDPI